ncbi:MAG: hypothetical protein SW127_21920, partial [Actinomycetota bacterium]|nr:hypothetical protein [Actinomycetota bacterium]
TAKAVRPNTKWSMWGWPHWGSYLDRSEERKKNALAPTELFAVLDWFSPWVYDWHKNEDSPKHRDWDRAWVYDTIELTKEVSGDRPIFPYICHRFCPPGDKSKKPIDPPGFALIPDEELKEHVAWALQAGTDGVVWWGGDNFHIRLIQKNPPPQPGDFRYFKYLRLKDVYRNERPEGMSYVDYLDSIHRDILGMLSEVASAEGRNDSEPDGPQRNSLAPPRTRPARLHQ